MKTRFEIIGDVDLVRIEGHVDAGATGPLCDLLAARARYGRRKLIVELGEDVRIVRPGVRGLVVASKLMRTAGGQFAVVAGPELGGWLHRVSFAHLLPVHQSRAAALAALGETAWRIAIQDPGRASNRPAAPARLLPRVVNHSH
ncbi:hypothetical protein [Histidinibacterium aquaticum]|uniref:Anti-sigma factor antagonist n=1 Tax=Histidinibacterium aquaticum TaxID=2613962 RepID=A0A5J5GC47_9RHOB|nr:hypothetical protein [Histidinibacterium aquaticum]KAA9005577.1 hypothetical protein F3S47_16875 [Histidinibacterium aquaticum]